MSKIIKKIELLESLIEDFAKEKIDDAYQNFERKYDYDPRSSGDKLVFKTWKIDDKLKLIYKEVTPHDCPYSISLELDIKYLKITGRD